jgi:hypothetical protein
MHEMICAKHFHRLFALPTRMNQNDYMQKRKIANGICKRKKEGMAKR